MKKLYRFSSLLLISPVLGVITACHNDKPVIGYGYLESMELVNNASFEQPNPFDIEDPSGNALIPSDVEGQRWNLLNSTYSDLRLDTMPESFKDSYRYTNWFTFENWSNLLLELDMTIHFKHSDFDEGTWKWLDQPGEYKVGGDKDLNVIFDQRTPAHFQFGFDVYSEINKEQGTDPSNRAHQLQFRASSTTVNKFISYKILNEFLKLSIIENTDGVNWNLSWIAPLCSFYNDWTRKDNELGNFEFKLLTESIDMSQITTPSGDTIGMKYNTQPVSKYFTLASIDYGKVWS